MVLKAKIHSAKEVPDQDGLKLLLKAAGDHLPRRLSHLWVDAGYQGRGKEWAEQQLGLSVEVVHRTPKPIPQKIAKIWAQEEWAKEAVRSTGRSCLHVEASRYYRGVGWWNAPSLG